MAEASRAVTFSVDQAAKIARLLNTASPQVAARYERHQLKQDSWRGLARERNASLHAANQDLQKAKIKTANFKRELQRHALAETVTGEDGEKRLHPQLQEYADQEDLAAKRVAQLNAMAVGKSYFDEINLLLEEWPANRVLEWDSDIPDCPSIGGKSLAEIGEFERDNLSVMLKEYDAIYSLPVDKVTAEKRIRDFVAMRAKSLDIGGIIRGESVDSSNRRSLRVLNPSPTIPMKQVVYGMDSSVEDTFGIACWLHPDLVIAKLIEQYNVAKSMPPLEKAARIPAMELEIWKQRALVEVIACAVEEQGGTFTRPDFTPAEILLGVAPLIGYAPDSQIY